MRVFGLKPGLKGSTAMAALLFAGGAWAQAPEAPADETAAAPDAVEEAAEASEEIVVTGSRIATRPLNAPQPILAIGQEKFELTGGTNAADTLSNVPALIASFSTAQAAQAPGNTAAATLNLRGMGISRTLVLVDGKRHVSGEPGTAAVDTASIPSALIERVEVLTGGASAVYGSDAVTGVVNFIMKKDFEGYSGRFQAGTSSRGDGNAVSTSHVFGANFGAEDRGNVTVAFQGEETNAVFFGARDFSRGNAIANDYSNPALRFQAGDPTPTGTTASNALGRTILLGSGAPRFAGTPQALIERARAAAPRVYRPDPRFSISATSGLIGLSPVGFGFFAGGAGDFASAAINSACAASLGGSNKLGFAVGCWIIDPANGQFRQFRDGIYAGNSNQFGGDGAAETFDGQDLSPDTKTFSAQVDVRYRVSDLFQPYLSAKAVHTDIRTYNPYNSFDDNIIIPLDNPFIPAAVRGLIAQETAAGGRIANVTIARDNIDIYSPMAKFTRETYRVVGGFTGDFENGWSYEVSFNYGKTEGRTTSSFRLEDRYFAALDAVTDPATGQPTCRINLNPAATVRRSGLYDQAFAAVPIRTFNPASRACVPLNLFGADAPSAAARAWQDYRATDKYEIDQFVAQAVLVGDSGEWFSLPGGPIGFAIGAEYRRETSEFTADPFRRQGFVFNFSTTANVTGEFEVSEGFAELAFPILDGAFLADTLSLNVAGRISSYSTIGDTTTWRIDGVWAPIPDIRFRGGKSVAVRAPNISELFSPEQSAVFRPIDPCDAAQINRGPAPANRLANCRADGIPVGFVDPLTARFVGVTGGNRNLQEETAETWTAGVVLRPSFLPGFSAAVDYWSIEIDQAIAAVSAQNIVNACYDAPAIAGNPFCALFTRNRTAGSPTFLGFNFLRQTQVNFAKLEASGVDFDVNFNFELAELGLAPEDGRVALGVTGTWLEKRNNFEVVSDPTARNPEKGELNLPEWALNTTLQWSNDVLTVSLFSTYLSSQTLSGMEIESIADFGGQVTTGSIWLHDVSVRWQYSEMLAFTFGVNNVTDEEPYFGSETTPVSGVGRSYFIRAAADF